MSLNFSNTGASSWTQGGGFYLRSVNPIDNAVWGRSLVDLSAGETITPGQGKKFSFTAIAPMTGGAYNFQWRMSQGGSVFGSASTNKVVTVVVRQNAARYISQAVPTTAVKAGSTFSVKVTMENVGTTAWTQAGGFAISPADGYPTWGATKVGLAAGDNVARGSNKTFTITCTAPASPGSYTMRWRMRRDSSAFTGAFGDLTTSKTITVVP